jgi:hypothetical protein
MPPPYKRVVQSRDLGSVCAQECLCAGVEANTAAAVGGRAGKGLKAVLEGLGELWDEGQYAEELSLDAFMGRLKQN